MSWASALQLLLSLPLLCLHLEYEYDCWPSHVLESVLLTEQSCWHVFWGVGMPHCCSSGSHVQQLCCITVAPAVGVLLKQAVCDRLSGGDALEAGLATCMVLLTGCMLLTCYV
jgi:hypothetical protein